jgi:hypothetical protein
MEKQLKSQFAKGPQAPLTENELQKERAAQEQKLDDILPFMRKQAEYDRLQMELTELDVIMGRLPIAQVGGLLGLELKVREIQAQGFLAQWAAGQREAMEKAANEMPEEERKAYEEFMKLSPEEQNRLQQEAIEAYNKAEEEAKAAQGAQEKSEN